MISLFRKHLQGRFLRYIIYIISFFVIFPSAFLTFSKWFDGGTWVVKVGGNSVGIEEYQRRVFELQQQINRFKQMFGENAEQFLRMQGLDKDVQKIALDSLIDQKLLEAVANQLHISLSPEYVNQQLVRMVPRELIQPDGSIDLGQLARAYNTDVSQIKKQLTDQMIASLLMQLTDGSVYVPQFLLKEKFIQSYTPRRFLIADFPLQKLVKAATKKEVSLEELRKFFDSENRRSKRYWIPEKRAGIVWTFDADHYPVENSEKQIEKYYNQNKFKEFIAEPAKVQVRRIVMHFNDNNKVEIRSQLAKIKQEVGTDEKLFTERAKEFSQDAATKKTGGLTPFFERGTYSDVFDQAAFRLAKDGDVSPIIETADGFELIQRVAKKAQTFKSLDQARATIKNKLRAGQFNRVFQASVRRALAQEDALKALEKFAQEKGGKKMVVSLREKGSEPYMQRFFAARKGFGGSIIQGATGYALYVSDIEKGYQPKFDDVKNQVKEDFYQHQAKKELEKELKAAEKVNDKKDFLTFTEKNGLSIESTGMISQQMDDAVKKLVTRLGMVPSNLFSLTVPGTVVTIEGEGGGFVVCLDAIAPFDEKGFEEQKEVIKQRAYQEQQQLIQSSFIASLYKNATIKINEKIIK